MWDEMFGGGESWYDVAQICRNGHVVNDSTKQSPQHSTAFCERCGQPTITQCENCHLDIRGDYHIPNVFGSSYDRPAFCIGCGTPYPWTASAIQAAKDLADEIEGLDANERDTLKESFDHLVVDSAQTTVAVSRFKRLAAKAGLEAAAGLRSILVDVISESAKKMLWGP